MKHTVIANGFFTLALLLALGLTNANAQNAPGKSPSDKPAPEKPSLGGSLKDWAKDHKISAHESPVGGLSICRDLTKDVKICVDKNSTNPKRDYGAHLEWKW